MNYFNELLQYTTLSNFKFKYNRVTVQFSCLINKKKIWPSTAWHFYRRPFSSILLPICMSFIFLSLFACLLLVPFFFSFITLVWGKYKQLNSVKHRMPYVLIESACCRIWSKKNCKFYIKTEKNHNLQGWKIKCSCIMVVVLHWFCKHEFSGEAGFASTTKLNTQYSCLSGTLKELLKMCISLYIALL